VTRVRVDRKKQGAEWPGVGPSLGVESGEKFLLNFQAKMRRFMHFYCEKLCTCGWKPRTMGFNRPPGNWRGRLNACVMEMAGKAFYGGMELACNGNSV